MPSGLDYFIGPGRENALVGIYGKSRSGHSGAKSAVMAVIRKAQNEGRICAGRIVAQNASVADNFLRRVIGGAVMPWRAIKIPAVKRAGVVANRL